jgi:UDP-N-acetylglucosamine acyltransferase
MAVDTNVVLGLNRLGLRRNGFDQERRRAIYAAYKVLYRAGLNRSQALDVLETSPEFANNTDIQLFCQFIKNSKRGICKMYSSHNNNIRIEDDM